MVRFRRKKRSGRTDKGLQKRRMTIAGGVEWGSSKKGGEKKQGGRLVTF